MTISARFPRGSTGKALRPERQRDTRNIIPWTTSPPAAQQDPPDPFPMPQEAKRRKDVTRDIPITGGS